MIGEKGGKLQAGPVRKGQIKKLSRPLLPQIKDANYYQSSSANLRTQIRIHIKFILGMSESD